MANLMEILREGQTKTLEQMALMKKQVAGTLTADESTRLAMLNGNLLALARQAQSLGFGTQVTIPDTYSDEDEYEDEDEDEYYTCPCGDVNCGYA